MRKIIAISVLGAILFTACGSATPASTTMPTEVPTETVVPFSALQLDDMLIQPNDLPAGISGAQISYQEVRDESIPAPADYYIKQELAFQDKNHGDIKVWIYENMDIMILRYQNRINELEKECAKTKGQCEEGVKPIMDLGTEARMIEIGNYIGANSFILVYRHCSSVVEITFWTIANDPEGLIVYGQRLDKRLSPIVCR